MNTVYDVIIVGTGAAGLFCALNFPETKKVCIITKRRADESDSFLAQGGICMLRGEEDYEDYFEDTMRAGHYENNKKTVDLMIRSSNLVIRELIRIGVRFERDESGKLAFTKEGAHSQPRILFHEDITGKEITSTLLECAKKKSNIEIYEYTTMLDIICNDNACGGVVIADEAKNISILRSNNVVLACGGIGGIYKNSTNFAHITGDAIAIALKHGVEVENLNYVQIHPTTLFSRNKGRRFLISESVRGEGGILKNVNGERFVNELLPRDVVSAAVFEQMEKTNTPYVFLDISFLDSDYIKNRFSLIYQNCLAKGTDITKEPVKVSPAQHYFMGGIKVDTNSKTSLDRLFAVGETSCTGIHGANRLASNSLLEGLVFSHRAAKIINNSIKDIELLTKSVDKVNKTVDEIAAENKKLVVAAIKQQGGRIDD